MRNSIFAHLHCHTEYSLLDGTSKPDIYCKKAKGLGFKALAITDHGNVDGAIRFQKSAKEHGITSIIGVEAYIVPDAVELKVKGEKRGHVILLCKDEIGFHNLLRMLSFANLQGFYYKPRIDYLSLLNNCEGLVISTACIASFIQLSGGRDFLDELHMKLDGDLYLEVMPHDLEEQKELNQVCLDISGRLGIPLLATNDCHYADKDDWEAQKALLGVQYDLKWNDLKLEKYVLRGIHLRSADEMVEAFDKQGVLSYGQYFRAMKETGDVVEKCGNFNIERSDIHLPAVPGYDDDFECIWNICDAVNFEKSDEYNERLKRELDLIKKKDFSRYFLLVYDLLKWCGENDIMIGPGRGSVGGSLVAYYLGITSIDPIKHGLSFDRFINDQRIDFPDIDIDFDATQIHRVRERCEELYGEGCVASIGTFTRMKNRGVIRDVGKVLKVKGKDVDVFAKTLDDDDDLENVFKERSEGKEYFRKYPKASELALKLKGVIKTRGQHAAAIVISKDDLRDGTRANLIDRDGTLVVNWDMDDAEYMGLLKVDALKLDTVSVLFEAKRLIKENHNQDIVLEDINLEDPAVLKNISDGHTTGVFQVNTKPMTHLIKEMGVSRFSHLCDSLALVRPGPYNSGQTSEYIKRKSGKKWEPMHLLYEEVTKETYGIICYQEQIMEVIHKVAGLSYSTADKIRKVIGKKRDAKEFEPFMVEFIDGCKKQKTLTETQAKEFWEGLKEHAHYSFNKSHSTAYSIMALWTAWLKHYYPTEFICAALTYGGPKDKPRLVREAKRLGLQVMPPKVGISDPVKWIAKDGKLYVAYIEIKGIGPKMAEQAAGTKGKGKRRGFISDQSSVRFSGQLGTILNTIGAYDPESIPVEAEKYLEGIDFSGNLADKYPRLVELVGSKVDIEDALKGIVKGKFAKKVSEKKVFKGLKDCRDCSLRVQADQVVLPSWGDYNIIALGEAPGDDENREGRGFIGKSGDKLWNELGEYKITRKMLYVSNTVHCWPSKDGTPKKEDIDICGQWLKKEILAVAPIIILALGNVARYALTGEDSGIQSVSGETKWIEEHGFWACWCVHPSSVLRSPGKNKPLFKKGIKNFSDAVEKIGGI